MVAVAEDIASLAILPAKKGDLPAIVELAAQVHEESQWARFPLDRSRTRTLLSSLMESPDGVVLIAIEGGGRRVVASVACLVSDHPYMAVRIAIEFGVLCKSEDSGAAIARLVRAYEDWAKKRGAVVAQIGITNGVEQERTAQLYSHLGFGPTGCIHMKEL